MKKYLSLAGAALALMLVSAPGAVADPMHVEAVMAPKQQMKLDFADGSRHFVLLVRREGVAEGTGPLAGGSVVEYGMHDIVPGIGGDPQGYLEITAANGDIAYVKWRVRAVFVAGPNGKPKLLDNGFWELAGGTGAFAGMKGAGTLHIKPAGGPNRRFILDGELFAGK